MGSEAENLVNRFNDKSILIIGDVMIDSYLFGDVNRISPEAPVPIVDINKKEGRLGGAANVALNIKELGGEPILVSVIGDDEDGYEFLKIMKENDIRTEGIILSKKRRTTVKTRVVSQNNQMLRFDFEDKFSLDSNTELLLLDKVLEMIELNDCKAVVLQDYNKGVLSSNVIRNVLLYCKKEKIPTAVDPKKHNFFEYKGCTLFKPNLKEASEGLGRTIDPSSIESLEGAALQLEEILSNTYTVITLSEKGIFYKDEKEAAIGEVYAQRVYDVSGAGDTVISVLTMGLSANLDLEITIELANIAASIVCSKVGVKPILKEDLIKKVDEELFNTEIDEEEIKALEAQIKEIENSEG